MPTPPITLRTATPADHDALRAFDARLIAEASLPGATPEKFLFTVRSPEVVAQLNAAMGKRVTLNYEQHKGLPTSCFGETEYFVTGMKEVAP